MSVSVIICAAGKGLRAGFEKNKLLVCIDGTPVLQKTLQAFCLDEIDEIIVACSPTDLCEIQTLAQGFDKVKLIEGGDTRTQTVYNALQAATGEIVLIHDGARPFVSRTVIKNCIRSVVEHGSGICAVPCTDTIAVKGVPYANAPVNVIAHVPDRNILVRIQTPQGFYLKDIARAYARAIEQGKNFTVTYEDEQGEHEQVIHSNSPYTDDSAVYNDFICPPTLCEGSEENVKLTYPSDFERYSSRVGFGIDTHAFGKEQNYIVLAGVKIPSHSGLVAHSDGDVLVHAVMDAMLSAAGLKDIGHYFPDTDEKWKNANSMQMLLQVKKLLYSQGFAVKNLSVAIHAEKPRLAKYIDEIRLNLANALDCAPSEIGVGAGTNEGLGYVGEGKGITVYAYALLKGI